MGGIDNTGPLCTGDAIVEFDPVAQTCELTRRYRSFQQHVVDLLDPEARVRDPEGEITIVGHEHEALRVKVKTTHRIRDRLGGNEGANGRSILGIIHRGDHSGGFVYEPCPEIWIERKHNPIDQDRVVDGVDTHTDACRIAADGDPSLLDQYICFAT
jgi:hypothetical protein